MIIRTIDERIRKAFSDAAMHYDTLTSLHKEIGRELTRKIDGADACTAVLDIGMGTGWYTRHLKQQFPEAMVVGIDSASGMIARAREMDEDIKIVQADARYLPFKEGAFGIITSNLAYQWIGELTEAFRDCHSLLAEDGIFCLTMFGHDTFHELFAALEACAPRDQKGSRPVSRRLVTADEVATAMEKAAFRDKVVHSEHIKVRFKDMMDLIKWVKNIGANALPKDMFIGKDLLLAANDHYNRKYRDRLGVYATFEVIWVSAKK